MKRAYGEAIDDQNQGQGPLQDCPFSFSRRLRVVRGCTTTPRTVCLKLIGITIVHPLDMRLASAARPSASRSPSASPTGTACGVGGRDHGDKVGHVICSRGRE